MKKLLSVVALSLILVFALAACSAPKVEPVKMGRVEFAAHGDKCFTVTVVAMQGDKIVGVSIDEYQFMANDGVVGVPNSDGNFGTNYPDGKVLVSKVTNNDVYSANMAKAGSTVKIADNFAAIETYAVGKTIAELETFVSKPADEVIDGVTGATLVDIPGYLQSVIAAAKVAK